MRNRNYYQYLPSSEKCGEICMLIGMFVEDGEVYYEFDNGDVCFEDLICKCTTNKDDFKGKLLVELNSKSDVWKFEKINDKVDQSVLKDVQHNAGKDFEIPTFGDRYEQKKDNILITPPSNRIINVKSPNYKDYLSNEELEILGILPSTNSFNKINECSDVTDIIKYDASSSHDDSTSIKNDVINNKIDNDPVAILVNSATKFATDVNMQLSINLPATSIFKIVNENFENGAEKFINVILNDIKYDAIKDALKLALFREYSAE